MQTKLAPPRLHARLVERADLLAKLDEGLERKLTLLSAPAGFGKTTLVLRWLTSVPLDSRSQLVNAQGRSQPFCKRIAWLSLDSGDNDPVRFWGYALTSCQRFAADLGAASLAQLRTLQPPSFESLLTIFINELAELPVSSISPKILVLEDYHVITNPQLHAAMTFLLDHLPPALHLVITTRHDPPLPLARLRAHQEINELTANDLRFSTTETEIFVQQTLALPLAPETIARLSARTEGWVTGLRLATLALQNRQTPEEVDCFLNTFAGNHRHILDYLVDEVLAVQPVAVQEFLLRTTLLSRLTGSLCDAVTGRDDSALLLEQLARANLFLIPLDDNAAWYRYHALFAEAMQHLAQQQLGAAQLRILSNQASLWHAEQGFLPEAVETALAAEAFNRAADLITQLIEPRLINNEYNTLRRWLAQLPEAVLRTQPALSFTYALAIQFTSDRRAAETMMLLETPLRLAEEQWQAQDNQRQLGAVQTVRAMAAWWQGDLALTYHSAHAALASLPEDEIQWRSISLLFIASQEMFAGQLGAARQTVVTARALCELAGNIYGLLSATNVLADVITGQGELHQAAGLYRQVIVLIEEQRLQTDQARFDHARALTGLAAIHLAWNDLDAAQAAAEAACHLGRQIGEEFLYASATLILADVLQARRQYAEAQQLLYTLIAQTPQRRWHFLGRMLTMQQARLALVAGDLAAAQHWSMNLKPPPVHLPLQQQEAEALLCARLHTMQGEPEEALGLLKQWQYSAQTGGRIRSQMEIHLLTSLVYFSQEKLPQAKTTLHTALILAQPQGEQQLFLREGELLAALLRTLLPELKEEPLFTHARTLLLAFAKELVAVGGASAPGSGLPFEALSPQEKRVLRLLAVGLSNPEIAHELIVSLNTIKSQVQSIFRKLNVNNRQEAQAVARQLKLY